MKKLVFLSSLLIAGVQLLHAEPVVYTIDPVHSAISFKIRNFVNKVPGEFTRFSGSVTFDAANPTGNKTEAVIEAASVMTRDAKRDKHLQNEDFFNVGTYPEIRFVSTGWEKLDDTHYKVTGSLTMLDQTHPVTLEVEYMGTANKNGTEIAGFQGTTKLDRTRWGITYGSGAPLGDSVDVELTIQAARKQ